MAGVKTAIIGGGNIGSTFSHGWQKYTIGPNKVGLWQQKVAGLQPADMKIVAAFDVDPLKVGKPLGEAASAVRGAQRGADKGPVIQAGMIAEKEEPASKSRACVAD